MVSFEHVHFSLRTFITVYWELQLWWYMNRHSLYEWRTNVTILSNWRFIPWLFLFSCISNRNAYKCVEISFKFRDAFSLLFKLKQSLWACRRLTFGLYKFYHMSATNRHSMYKMCPGRIVKKQIKYPTEMLYFLAEHILIIYVQFTISFKRKTSPL